MIPWFPGGHCDPWNHVETAMALDVAGLHARGRARLRVARRHPAPRRQLVELLPARRHRRGGQARHQRVRVHRHRRVAPLAVHLGPRRSSTTCGRPSSGRSTGCCGCASPTAPCCGRAPRTTARGTTRCSPARRASPTRCAARRNLATLINEPRPDVDRPPPIGCADLVANRPGRVRAEGTLGDGLVLPGADRRADRRAGQGPPGRQWDEFAMEGKGIRCVSDEPWVTASRDRRVRDRLRRDRRPVDGHRSAALDPLAPPATTARTGPASSTRRRAVPRSARPRPTPRAAVILAADAIDRRLPRQRRLRPPPLDQ